jgi:hypothetical protein
MDATDSDVAVAAADKFRQFRRFERAILEHDLEEEKPEFPQDHGSSEMPEWDPI